MEGIELLGTAYWDNAKQNSSAGEVLENSFQRALIGTGYNVYATQRNGVGSGGMLRKSYSWGPGIEF